MTKTKLGIALVLVVFSIGTYLYASGSLPSFDSLKESRVELLELQKEHPLLAPLVFGLLYIVVVALSLPIATPLSLLGGFLFGTILGTLAVVVSATIGATLIFIATRYFFREYVTKHILAHSAIHTPPLSSFSDVLIARLIPLVPFSFINIAAGLTAVTTRSYALATAIGIVPFSFVYVLAGTRLGEIESVTDIVSPQTFIVVSVIGVVLFALNVVKRRFSDRSSQPQSSQSE
jgi:uncharacterized membrane protein YdjX (TVP38/TMEM64 family)